MNAKNRHCASTIFFVLSAMAFAPAAFSEGVLSAGSEASCSQGFPVICGPGDNVYGPNGSYNTGGGDTKSGSSSSSSSNGSSSSTSSRWDDKPAYGSGGGSIGAAPQHNVSCQVQYYSSNTSAAPWAAKPYVPPARVTQSTTNTDMTAAPAQSAGSGTTAAPAQQPTKRTAAGQQTTVRAAVPTQQTTVRAAVPTQQTTTRTAVPARQTTTRTAVPAQQTTTRTSVGATPSKK